MISRRHLLAAVPGLGLLSRAAGAQAWPVRPVRFITGFAPGGTIDYAARVLGEKLSPGWGQTVVVENRTGAGGTLAGMVVARAEPDGHTLLVSSAAEVAVAPFTIANLAYNPQTDLTPISLIARNPFALVVPADLEARSVEELVALSKKEPLSYASSGIGTTTHFVSELFKLRTGADIEHVPYRGSAQLQTDLHAGRVHMAFDAVSAVLPHIQAGKLRAIGVAIPARSALAPEIPTLDELGLKGFVGGGWCGFLGPAKLPAALVERLEADVRAAMKAGVAQQLAAQGFEPIGSTAAELKAFIAEETARWGEVAQKAQIKPG